MQLRCRSDDDSYSDILHCSHRRLIHKRFQLASEEEIKGIEVRGSWMPSNRFALSNPTPGGQNCNSFQPTQEENAETRGLSLSRIKLDRMI
ncbi:hypothetical protein TNCV_3640881 [Trichonephila clavipes]|nr:hypothetical protein TNCV_3640881 [Trichonephila clavipes]